MGAEERVLKRWPFDLMPQVVLVVFWLSSCLCRVSALSQPLLLQRAISIAQVHRRYKHLTEGKHCDEQVVIEDLVIDKIKQTSPRLAFLRVRDCSDEVVELLLRERDNYLSLHDINDLVNVVQSSGDDTKLSCVGFPEKLGAFDGPTFFPHLNNDVPSGVCLHVMAATVTSVNGEQLLEVGSLDEATHDSPATTTEMIRPGRMPPLEGLTSRGKKKSRGGGNNRDRGGMFAAWVVETFGLRSPDAKILDIAGGAGQLAFQLGVRRGHNVTVVDPRPQLRLASDQQRTLRYHREQGLRILPSVEKRDTSLPKHDYGHHFCEISEGNEGDRTWLVGGNGARVRHLSTCFDADFVDTNDDRVWSDCSVVLGMHPDEATEDLVDLALQDDKPFAVVPCCVFWRLSPLRKTPKGKAVRTWEQFCEYLAAKDTERIQITTLPNMPGRNVVLYSVGSSSGSTI